MKTLTLKFLMPSLLISLLLTSLAHAENHKALATQEAVACEESAKKGDVKEALRHAEAGKAHAEAAKAERSNPHLDAGIRNLDEAITNARVGEAHDAEESASAAVTHLLAAEKAF